MSSLGLALGSAVVREAMAAKRAAGASWNFMFEDWFVDGLERVV